MQRKRYTVTVGAGCDGDASATVYLTDVEADAVRFALDEVVRASEDGAIDFAAVEEAA